MNANRLLAVILTICLCACCPTHNDVMVTPLDADKTFMSGAAYANLFAVDAGRLSLEKSGDATVKNFGQLIAENHNAAQQELKDIAAYFNYELPAANDSLHAAQKELLQALTGRAFDSVFILLQVNDYNKTIDLYQARIEAGTSGLVSRYAQKYLPLIRSRLNDAQNIKEQIKLYN